MTWTGPEPEFDRHRREICTFILKPVSSQYPREPLLRREGQSLRPPIFPGTFSVWHGLSAKQADQGTVQAGMSLRRWRQFRTNFGRVEGDVTDSRAGLKMGDLLGDIHKIPH